VIPPETRVDPAAVADAVASVRERIRRAAGDRDVQLIAVTKGFGADAIDAVMSAGCTAIGENYAQELLAKLRERDGTGRPLPEVHFIGQLQRNKVRVLAAEVDVWQTIDRAPLAAEVAARAPGARTFVQVNTTAEEGKGGCAPADVAALVEHARTSGLQVSGLMTVGPTSGDVDGTRRAFGLLRRLADDEGLVACSMGMSGDLEIAVEHGATHVRIGSALFGERPLPRRSMG
jgi:pyridoxal phosphate enzyme (YggS family)